MNKKCLLELAEYYTWANGIVIEWLEQISDDQWRQDIVSSFGGIRRTTIHMVSAEKIWVDFWTRVPEPAFLSAGFNGTKDDLIKIWRKSSAELKDFIEKYPEERYQDQVAFKRPGGEEGRMEFSQTLFHIITHSTYHRGQLVTMLRQVGFTNLCATDLSTYYQRGSAGHMRLTVQDSNL